MTALAQLRAEVEERVALVRGATARAESARRYLRRKLTRELLAERAAELRNWLAGDVALRMPCDGPNGCFYTPDERAGCVRDLEELEAEAKGQAT